jgi:hypothetical protein
VNLLYQFYSRHTLSIVSGNSTSKINMPSPESWRDRWGHLRRLIDGDDYTSILTSNFSRELLLIGIKYTFDCTELEEERARVRSLAMNQHTNPSFHRQQALKNRKLNHAGVWNWYERDLQACVPMFWWAFDEFVNETATQMREILRIRLKELADMRNSNQDRHGTLQSTRQIDPDAEIAAHMNAVYLSPDVSGSLDFTASPQAHLTDMWDGI